MSLSAHQSARMKNDEWLTPPAIIQALGEFDLDPCSPKIRPWKTAKDHISRPADGLKTEWWGRVWCNPPFGNRSSQSAPQWAAKMAAHGNGILLLPARTETRMFFEHVWPKASAICFLNGRPHFHFVDGTRAKFNSGAPICLIAYGKENAMSLIRAGLGKTILL